MNHNLRIDTGEGLIGGMDRKKQKTVSRVWRKVSTQSSSQQGEVSEIDLKPSFNHD